MDRRLPRDEDRLAPDRRLTDKVTRTFAALSEALDRILGLEPGRLPLTDPPTLRTWFG